MSNIGRPYGRRRNAWGTLLVVVSVLALLVALGAPGIGWMLAVGACYGAGLGAGQLRRTHLAAVLALALLQLFWIGPLAGFAWPRGDLGAGFIAFFLVLPLAVPALVLALRR